MIASRANSKIYKVGDKVRKEVTSDLHLLTLDTIIESYRNYDELLDKNDLVKVHKWWVKDNTVFIDMEDLTSWWQLGKNDKSMLAQVLGIMNNLIRQGYVDWDMDISNFLTNGKDVKLIDLDRLTRCDSLTTQQSGWLTTRIIRLFLWYFQ